MKFNVFRQSNKDGQPALADSPNSESVSEEEEEEEEAFTSAMKVQEILDGVTTSLNRQVDVLKITRTAGVAALGWLSQGLILLFHHTYVDCIDPQDERMLQHNNQWRLLWGVLAPLVAGSGWWWLVEQRARVQQGCRGDRRSHAPNVASAACQTTGIFIGLPLKDEDEGLGDRRDEGQGRGNEGLRIPDDEQEKDEAAYQSQNEKNKNQNAFQKEGKSSQASSRNSAFVAQDKSYADELSSMKDKYEKREKLLKEAHALEFDRSKTEIQNLKQTYQEQLRTQEDLKWDFVRAATIINGKSLFIMARFRMMSNEQECAPYLVDDKGGFIEANESDGGDKTTPGGRFPGLSGIVTRYQDNKDVWRLLHPGFMAFTCGHPVCLLVDGYSGSGKSHTMFNGPASIVNSMSTALFEWKEQMDSLARPMSIEFEAVIVEPHPRPRVTFPPLETLNELDEAIKRVLQMRDNSNRRTNNNASSSRSHLVMRFKATLSNGSAKSPIKPWSSFCLVDLAGNERTEDQKGGREAPGEVEERHFINRTRTELHGMLKDSHNLSYKGDLTKHLLEYIFINNNKGDENQKKQRPLREPKVFVLSCLSPTAASRQMTINTLKFSQELLEARRRGA